MITSVSSYNARGNAKDPRRKSQSVQFRKSSDVPNQSGYRDQHSKHKSNAQVTSGAIVAGSVLFTVGYFVLSGMSMGLKKAAKFNLVH
jgi:hypothetical protein